MSEQGEREKAEMRVRIAGDRVVCPYLEVSHDAMRLHDEPDAMGCKCKGTGRVYRFGDALRQPCMGGRDGEGCEGTGRVGGIARDDHGRRLVPVRWEEGLYECEECLGRGWRPAENFMPKLLEELLRTGFAFRMDTATDRVIVWGPEGAPKVEFAFGADPELKTYRAVLAVLDAAPGDYRRARGVSPLPPGAEMPEDTIRRLRGG